MKWILLTASLFSFNIARAQVRPEIIFDSHIEIPTQNTYVLGDLIQLKNPSVALMESVEKLAIPQEQIEKGLDPQSVREIYKQLVLGSPALAIENPKLIVSAKIDIKVVPGFSEAHFRRKLINHLTSQCSPCEVTIQKALIPTRIMAKGQIDWEEVKLAPSVLIPVTSAEEKNIQGQWITVTLKIKKNALVALRNMNFGDRISEKDFENKWMDVSFAREETLSFDSIKNYQLVNQPIQKGRVVYPSQFKQEPAAQKGQSIKALLGDSDIEISIAATAEETGRIGDMIKIKNTENKKIMSAIIIDKGVVKIQ